jgi:hypothetical protein
MRYLKVHTGDPFLISVDGDYQEQVARARLEHDPFTYTKVTEVEAATNLDLPDITLASFMRLHSPI